MSDGMIILILLIMQIGTTIMLIIIGDTIWLIANLIIMSTILILSKLNN